MSIASSIAGGGSSSGSGGGGGIGGSTGLTDNKVLRADGTGGTTAQGSGATLDDSVTLTVNGLLCYPGGNQSGDEKVQLAGGAGGTLFSSDSDIRWYDDPDISSGVPTVSISRGSSGGLSVTDGTGTGGMFIELVEMASPSAPGANKGRLYLKDNGSGKTQLVVRFPSGAEQIIATEP